MSKKLEKLELNDAISFALVYESLTDKMKLLEGKFLDEVIDYSLSEEEKKTLEKEYYLFGEGEFMDNNNRIRASNFLSLIFRKIHNEKDITTIEFELVTKIFGWRGFSIGQK